MVDPKVILWTSMKGVVYSFYTNRGNGIKVGIEWTMEWYPFLNYMKNSYIFTKSVLKLVALCH